MISKAPKTQCQCPNCSCLDLSIINFPFKTFRHLDFEHLNLPSGENVLAQCTHCGHISRRMSQKDEDALEAMYQSAEYASHGNAHMVHSDSEGEIAAAEVQSRIILEKVFLRTGSRVLDVGCLGGKLLGAIGKKVRGAKCVGFDVGERPGFVAQEGCTFIKGSLSDLKGEFDLIILSHSLIYIKNLSGFFGNLLTLLAPNGKVFIHIPDVDVRPSTLLLGDQYHYFSGASMVDILRLNGFRANVITGHPFSRDIILFAEKESGLPMESPISGLSLDGLLGQLLHFQTELKQIPHPEVAILGTTIEASFAYSQIPKKVNFFLDENRSRVGRYFHGKPIFHPSVLTKGQKCLVPMGHSAQHIKDRFSSIYQGDFFLI